MNKKEILPKKCFGAACKKVVAIIVAFMLIIVFAIIAWGSGQSKVTSKDVTMVEAAGEFKPDMIYFYGQECARCKNIDQFVKENKIDEKISFTQKEVWHDGSNVMEMQERAKECQLDPEKVGVPFLWARGKCYIGEVEVEKFLKTEVSK